MEFSLIKGFQRQFNYLYDKYPKRMETVLCTMIVLAAMGSLISLLIAVSGLSPIHFHIGPINGSLFSLLCDLWIGYPFVLGGQALFVVPSFVTLIVLMVRAMLKHRVVKNPTDVQTLISSYKNATTFLDRIKGRNRLLKIESQTQKQFVIDTYNIKQINGGRLPNIGKEMMGKAFIFKDKQTRDFVVYYGDNYKDTQKYDLYWKDYPSFDELIKHLKSDIEIIDKKEFEKMCPPPVKANNNHREHRGHRD
jgi:hypothetical protein